LKKYEIYKLLLPVSFIEACISGMYKRLLVAVDGSEQSYKALDQAVAIAEKFDSELIVLTIISNVIKQLLINEGFDPRAQSITKISLDIKR